MVRALFLLQLILKAIGVEATILQLGFGMLESSMILLIAVIMTLVNLLAILLRKYLKQLNLQLAKN
jgi:hypothetical protein